MKITKELFEAFWRDEGQYMKINNKHRRENNLATKIEELGDIAKLDDYVKSLRTGKESTRKIVIKFYDYLKNKKGFPSIDSDLYKKDFYGASFERQLEIAKFLHKKRTIQEICEHFCISPRTVREDIKKLEDGITVFDTTIQISKEKKGRYHYYKTTLHPIFLPLNLTEVYALTLHLGYILDKNDPSAQVIQSIISRVKGQLSDYAIEKLFPNDVEDGVKNYYIDDEELASQRENVKLYLMKSSEICRFIYNGKEYRGRFNRNLQIQLDNGEILDADLKDVEVIIDSFEYK